MSNDSPESLPEKPNPEEAHASVVGSSGTRQQSRDVNVSTVVRLMGLSTSQDMNLLDAKLEAILTKLSIISSRLDRLTSQVNSLSGQLSIDRLDGQIADLRATLKKLTLGAPEPHATSVGDSATRVVSSTQVSLTSKTDADGDEG